MFTFAFITYLLSTAKYHINLTSFISRVTRMASQGDSEDQVCWISERHVPFLTVGFGMHWWIIN